MRLRLIDVLAVVAGLLGVALRLSLHNRLEVTDACLLATAAMGAKIIYTDIRTQRVYARLVASTQQRPPGGARYL